MNSKHQFKTNINCGGCVATVKPHLENVPEICEWNVDTNSRDKILTVTADGIGEEQVMELVRKAGFKIESFKQQ